MQQTESQVLLIVVIGTLMLVLISTYIIIFLFYYRRKQLQNTKEKAALTLKYEQEILRAQIEIQNQTLQHIGGELHDNIG